ncbi:hypothetical protein D3C81_432530 [compost metagenome]
MYTARYLISLGLAIIGCSIGYTIIIMWGIRKLFSLELEGQPYWIISGILFVTLSIAGLKFYIPRLRNIW